jgi:hypothetical protein
MCARVRKQGLEEKSLEFGRQLCAELSQSAGRQVVKIVKIMGRFEYRGLLGWFPSVRCVFLVCCFWQLGLIVAQQDPGVVQITNSTGLLAAQKQCTGVFLQYTAGPPTEIPPYAANISKQPYSFDSVVTLTNLGYFPLQQWEVSMDFQYNEIIAKVTDATLLGGTTTLPGFVWSNDTTVVGVSSPSLLTSIDTAEDLTLISANFTFKGTEFGFNKSGFSPLPRSIHLVNDGYNCTGIANGQGIILRFEMFNLRKFRCAV